jgi:hypothetical protein
MTVKTYRNGTSTGKTYLKNVGEGIEVGFILSGKKVFVGNFIHGWEARKWFSILNHEITSFSKKYQVGPGCSKSWFTHFLSSHLYNTYYGFLDKCFAEHTRKYQSQVTKEAKSYKRMSREWNSSNKTRFLKAA